ncbi:thioredoxin domain-containing protein [bacterium]|nr:thioredoxin domain-containing protein [bacterium]MBU1956817.1 thioredoxin domain-containing protein [bacterium]
MNFKTFLLTILFTLQVYAVDDNGVRHYIKEYMETKMKSPVDKIETISNYTVEGTNGWEVYFLSLEMRIKIGKTYSKQTVPQVVFTKGNKIAFSLKDEDDQPYEKLLKPKVPKEAYDDAHFLVGSKDAPHKLLVMSDPFCPYCQEIIPEMIEMVQDNPKTFGLYYYHLPLLRIHPASDMTTKAMHIFHKRGDISNLKSLYYLLVDPRETNEQVILKAIKEKTGVRFRRKEIHAADIKKALDFDLAMKKRLMVTGTPTIFLDDVWDPTRFRYKKYLK